MTPRTVLVHFAILFVITFPSVSAYEQELISVEDIEETSELLIEYIVPMFEERDLSIDDYPDLLKALIARYYIIFSRAKDPLETLEKMRMDYEMIKNNQRIEDEYIFEEYLDDFMEQNTLNAEVAIEEIVTDLLDFNLNSWEFRLQVIAPREAVKLLLYQEAYPDIMEVVSLMIQQHYETYKRGFGLRREDIENYKDTPNNEDNSESIEKNVDIQDNYEKIRENDEL